MWVRIVPQETAGQKMEDLLVSGWSMYTSSPSPTAEIKQPKKRKGCFGSQLKEFQFSVGWSIAFW